MSPRRIPAAALAFGLLLGVAACGSDDSSTQSSADASTTSELNTAEVEFAQGMIAHHEQAIEMAEMALDPNSGASPEVVDLATRIKAAQDPEVTLMTGWLTAAGESLTMDMSGGHDMMSMPGMMSADAMDELAMMTGADFDRMWLEMMIEHHEGAVEMARAEQEGGRFEPAVDLAGQIADSQAEEIATMRELLEG